MLFLKSHANKIYQNLRRGKIIIHFFNEYFETNIFLRGFYSERYNNIRSVIRGWKLKTPEDE